MKNGQGSGQENDFETASFEYSPKDFKIPLA
jgi:hypothetical protein